MERRRARPNNRVMGTDERPRFERFAAAMERARANEAPELGLYEGPAEYDDGPAADRDPPATNDYHLPVDDDQFAIVVDDCAVEDDQPPAYDYVPAAHVPAAYNDRSTAYADAPAPYNDRRAYHPDRPAADRDGPAAYHEQRGGYDDRPPTYHNRSAAYDGPPAAFGPPGARPALRPVVPRPRRARGWAALRWLGIAGCVLIVCVLIAGLLAWPETVRLLGRLAA